MRVVQIPKWNAELSIPIWNSIPDLRQTRLSEKLLPTALL
jgi:hypothetical protein